MATRNKAKVSASDVSASDILQASLALAEEKGWDNIRLYQVADQLGAPLDVVRSQFPDLNGVANEWFKQALREMLAVPEDGFADQPAWRRLHVTMMKWFVHGAQHRNVTAEMLKAKLHPPHVHHWVPMIFDLSQLMHWWLDAARIASVGRQRQIAEVGLTVIFVRTLAYWVRDGSPDQQKTSKFLERRLKRADKAMRLCIGPRSPAN